MIDESSYYILLYVCITFFFGIGPLSQKGDFVLFVGVVRLDRGPFTCEESTQRDSWRQVFPHT